VLLDLSEHRLGAKDVGGHVVHRTPPAGVSACHIIDQKPRRIPCRTGKIRIGPASKRRFIAKRPVLSYAYEAEPKPAMSVGRETAG
jgi:hypothetical protein